MLFHLSTQDPGDSREARERDAREAVTTEKKIEVEDAVDRVKTCPLLLRVFCREGGHHRPEDFANNHVPPEELQIYTWMDATLKELSMLVKETTASARWSGARLAFSSAYRDNGGRVHMRPLGTVLNSEPTPDESKTLRSLRFRIGDFVDIAIFTRQKREDGGPRRSLGGGPPSARTSIRDRLGGRDKDSERSGGRDRRPSRDADEISRLNRELERREREVARRERELAQA